MKTVTVKTAFGDIVAPRGFGAMYRRIAKVHAKHIADGKPGEVIDPIFILLDLVDVKVRRSEIADWNAQQRIEAEAYATNAHLRASDNPVQRHPKPDWLP